MQISLPFVNRLCRIDHSKENESLMKEIERSKAEIDSAYAEFDQAVDPAIIDCCIYKLEAAQMRYQYLITKAKGIGY